MPLIQAVRFGAIKFKKLDPTPQYSFGMESMDGLIKFEDDIYFYCNIDNRNLDRMIFLKDEGEANKTRLYQALAAINRGLRGINRD